MGMVCVRQRNWPRRKPGMLAGGFILAPRQVCKHERARFHSVQRLGSQPPVELWHCPACKSTLSAQALKKTNKEIAAA